MTRRQVQVFALTLVLGGVGALAGAARAGGDAPDPALKELAGYRQWTRVAERATFALDTAGG
ncbi:MAG TPA: hypothetical protein VF546_06800 [Pyrinomonadaceae bacterium]|jgi:hypothetical protein